LDDFTIDPKQVKQAISERTKAIMPVDIGGLPANYEALWDVILASKSLFKPNGDAQGKLGRIALVADAAHSIGARVKGELLGRQADAFVYSFHAVKNLTTAEGGAVCFSLPDSFDSSEIYAWLNTRSLHGQSKDALAKTQIGAWEYDVVDAGWKCNMTDLQAAIGLVELERYEQDTLPKRKSIADYYQNYFQIQPWALTPILKDQVRESSYHLYLLRIKGVSRMQRDQIIDRIFAKGVSVNVHYKPLPLLQAYTSRGYEIDDYPITKGLWEQEISLPIFYDMTDGQMKTVVDAVTSSVLEVIN